MGRTYGNVLEPRKAPKSANNKRNTYGSGILGATFRWDGGTYFDFCG